MTRIHLVLVVALSIGPIAPAAWAISLPPDDLERIQHPIGHAVCLEIDGLLHRMFAQTEVLFGCRDGWNRAGAYFLVVNVAPLRAATLVETIAFFVGAARRVQRIVQVRARGGHLFVFTNTLVLGDTALVIPIPAITRCLHLFDPDVTQVYHCIAESGEILE